MSTNGEGGDPEDRRLLEGRMYNLILEVLQGLNKIAPSIERLSRTLYDFLPMVETKHDYLIGEQRNHNADVKAALAAALSAVERDRKDLIEQIIAIRTATALAADNAGDAKNAANEARREATDQHKLHDKDKDTPDSAKGVGGAVVKGLGVWGKMSARSQVLLLILAMIVGAAITVVAYERLQRPPEPPAPQHQRHLEGTKP